MNNNAQYNYKGQFCDIIRNDIYNENILNRLDNKLQQNKNSIYLNIKDNKIDNNVKKYISLYLDLNIMIIYNNKYYNINTYNINKCTLILLLEDNKYIPVSKIFNNIEINYITNIIYEDVIYKYIDDTDIENSYIKILKMLKRLNIGELKEYVKNYDIDTCNMKKQDIYNYIKNMLNIKE